MASGQGLLGAIWGGGTEGEPQAGRGAGRLPGIMVEDTRRVSQKPAPELLPFPAHRSGRYAFRRGAGHVTRTGSVRLSGTRERPAGPRPLPGDSRVLGGKSGGAGRGGCGPGVPRPEAVTSAWGWVYLAEGALGLRGYPAKFRPGVVFP